MDLVSAALEGSDDDSQSNDGTQVDATDVVAEMTANVSSRDLDSIDGPSQAADQPPLAECIEEAVSQQVPADIELTPKKKKRKVVDEANDPKLTPPKIKEKGGAIKVEKKRKKQDLSLLFWEA